jgi:DNA repair protein RadD
MVKPREKYWDVVSHIVGPANDNTPPAANDNRRGYAEEWEEDIPF